MTESYTGDQGDETESTDQLIEAVYELIQEIKLYRQDLASMKLATLPIPAFDNFVDNFVKNIQRAITEDNASRYS